MKASGRNDTAVVEFTGKVQRIAQVHQFGLRDRPNPKGQYVRYTDRQLLEFSLDDYQFIEKTIITQLGVNKTI